MIKGNIARNGTKQNYVPPTALKRTAMKFLYNPSLHMRKHQKNTLRDIYKSNLAIFKSVKDIKVRIFEELFHIIKRHLVKLEHNLKIKW